METPKRGEIWVIDLDPTKGSEIKKTRPCLVLSRTEYNNRANTVTIIPCSSGELRYTAWEVSLGSESGLNEESRLLIPQLRVAAKERLKNKIGQISSQKWNEIEGKIMYYLGFDDLVSNLDSIETFLI